MKILSQLANEIMNIKANVCPLPASTVAEGLTFRQSFKELIATSSKQKGKTLQGQSSKSTATSIQQSSLQSSDASLVASRISKSLASDQSGVDNAAVKVLDSAFTTESPRMSFQAVPNSAISSPDVAGITQSTSSSQRVSFMQGVLSSSGSRVSVELPQSRVTATVPNVPYANPFIGLVPNGVAGSTGRGGDFLLVPQAGQGGGVEHAVDLDTPPRASGDGTDTATERYHPAPSGVPTEQGLSASSFTLSKSSFGDVQVAVPVVSSMSSQASDSSFLNQSTSIDPTAITTLSATERAAVTNLQPFANSFVSQPTARLENGLPVASSVISTKATQNKQSGLDSSVVRSERDLPPDSFLLGKPVVESAQTAKPVDGSLSLPTSDSPSSKNGTLIAPAAIEAQAGIAAAPVASSQPLTNPFISQTMPDPDSTPRTTTPTSPMKTMQGVSKEQNHSAPSVLRSGQEFSVSSFGARGSIVGDTQTAKPFPVSESLQAADQPSPSNRVASDSTATAAQRFTEAASPTNPQLLMNVSGSQSMPTMDSVLATTWLAPSSLLSPMLTVKTASGVSNVNVETSRQLLSLSKSKQPEDSVSHSASDRSADVRSDIKSSGEDVATLSVNKGTTGASNNHRDPEAGGGSTDAAPMQHIASVSQPGMPMLPNAAQSGLQPTVQFLDSRPASVVPAHTLVTNTSQQVQDLPVVNSAQLIQSLHHSEMRLGMQSAEFGNISISTSLNREVLSAHISIDHTELSRALSVHLPAIEEKLSSVHGFNTRVTVGDGLSEGTPGNSGQRSKDHAYQGSGQSTIPATSVLEPMAVSMSSASPAYAEASRLDIRI